MVLEDEFTKILLDKIIQNVISCLSVIENISELQHEKIKDCIGIKYLDFFIYKNFMTDQTKVEVLKISAEHVINDHSMKSEDIFFKNITCKFLCQALSNINEKELKD